MATKTVYGKSLNAWKEKAGGTWLDCAVTLFNKLENNCREVTDEWKQIVRSLQKENKKLREEKKEFEDLFEMNFIRKKELERILYKEQIKNKKLKDEEEKRLHKIIKEFEQKNQDVKNYFAAMLMGSNTFMEEENNELKEENEK